ncbi:MAG: type 2 isopentenyl-diphosphate Delta-isomerase, partial [Candidatus Granulicatella sp. P6S_S16_bin.50.1]|nr:type 2 isopentenyl-diphosphate Delta-isomerase [Candidatus Granulicatella sp. P6S_S16_bin.50.1]
MDLFQQQMNRKDEHVGHANQQYRATSAPEFVETRFVHHPFTTVDVADVSFQTKLGNLTFDVPFFINAITGGSPLTTALNQRLAILARETGMAMATGSMSIAMKFPESAESFK